MDIRKLIETLHPLERKVIPVLQPTISLLEIITATGLQEVEALRALQWLENKKIITLTTTTHDKILLGKNGQDFITKQLPERRVLNALKDKELPLEKLLITAHVSREELNVAIGILRSNNALIINKTKELFFKLTNQGKTLINQPLPEEKFLQKKFPLDPATFNADDKKIFETLKKRKDIIVTTQQKQTTAQLLELGQHLQKQGVIDKNVIDQITPDILKTGAWKNKTFRRFDTTIEPPKIHAGRLHHYRQFLDGIRAQFVSLGFTEMDGPLVETEFWNMDALYMPQFHSARDIHDAYYLREPCAGMIDQKFIKKIKDVHEHGGTTGSRGWQYSFDEQKTRKLLLRTQGTACSARMLASPHLKIPGKYFGITRCFRKDVIDATHNCDFYQTEGIVIEEGLTIRHLFGLLRMFAKEFAGATEIKLVPGYFPFTEPSAELFAKHPQLGWIELGGAGIFRPEVVTPLLGKNISVLAWGIGIDRIAMFKLSLNDIRALFSHDIEFLRNVRVTT